jgi:hypothetical protein
VHGVFLPDFPLVTGASWMCACWCRVERRATYVDKLRELLLAMAKGGRWACKDLTSATSTAVLEHLSKHPMFTQALDVAVNRLERQLTAVLEELDPVAATPSGSRVTRSQGIGCAAAAERLDSLLRPLHAILRACVVPRRSPQSHVLPCEPAVTLRPKLCQRMWPPWQLCCFVRFVPLSAAAITHTLSQCLDNVFQMLKRTKEDEWKSLEAEAVLANPEVLATVDKQHRIWQMLVPFRSAAFRADLKSMK